MDFKNKNILITGGSSGIGLSIAKSFINHEANVWITGRNRTKLMNAEMLINDSKFVTISADTSNLEGINAIASYFNQHKLKLDVLIINAGIGIFNKISETTEDEFDVQFNTNVKGSFFTLQKMIPFMNNGSSILFTSSTAATASIIGSSVYSSTKAAINKIAKIAANELADKNIRVNIISPGPIATKGFEKDVSEDLKKNLENGIALKRLGEPNEIANTVLFLASEKANFITGSEIIVDGGFLNYSLK